MKLFKIALVCLVLLFNCLIAQPSWADKPKLDTNQDYQTLTQTLNSLLQAKTEQTLPEGIASPEELQQQITQLQYQKYIVESGKGYGECRNESGQTIAVYGPKSKKSTTTFDNELYLLPDGEITDEKWDCDGVYLPSDAQVADLDLGTAGAIKILDGTRLTIKSNPETGIIEFNLPPANVFQSNDVNWDIPDLAQADISRQLPIAPTD